MLNTRLIAAQRMLDIALLADETHHSQHLGQAAELLAEQRRRAPYALHTSVRIDYLPAYGDRLPLDVYFKANDDDGIFECHAYLPDSATEISALLDWDVLCDLIDETCRKQAALEAAEYAFESKQLDAWGVSA